MIPPRFDLDGRRAIVTGGSSGIGKATAQRFADAGAAVAICSRDQDRIEDAAAEITAEGVDGAVLPVKCDVTDRAAVEALVEATVAEFGGLDVLVNNAGANFYSEFGDISPNGWDTIVDINLGGTVNCLQAARDHLRAADRAAAINLSSFVARYPSPQQSHYGAAKAAVSHLTGTVAAEWAGDGVRVNAVAPGVIQTPGVEHVLERDLARVPGRETVDRGIGQPEEVADLVQFLVSPAASFITGEVVPIRGVPQPVAVEERFQ
jgi:NAD(P)-dependent dehydrogenase (short-subunit alcohol dehydrogenase family)